MSYSRWSNSRWYTFWSAMGAETAEFRWPTRKLREGQVFEICDMPSYHITYGELKRRSRSAVLHEIEGHFAQDFEWTDMEGTTHVSRSVPPTWDELMELQDYSVQLTKLTGSRTPFANLALDGKDDPAFQKDKDQKNKDFAQLNFAETPLVAALEWLS